MRSYLKETAIQIVDSVLHRLLIKFVPNLRDGLFKLLAQDRRVHRHHALVALSHLALLLLHESVVYAHDVGLHLSGLFA